ncbi:hypothetical protein TH24_17030 [Thalassospira xiamenensis]|nr:hypothetical protein TH24_17030 [Thalassospira xiamenensis]
MRKPQTYGYSITFPAETTETEAKRILSNLNLPMPHVLERFGASPLFAHYIDIDMGAFLVLKIALDDGTIKKHRLHVVFFTN